jgi:hypothetical protein
MSTSGGIEAGRAFLKLYTEDSAFQRGIDGAVRRIQSLAGTLKHIGTLGAGIGTAMSVPFIAAIKHASDAQESLNKFRSVFGEQSKAAEEFASTLAKSVGRSEIDIKNALSSFQGFFVGLGFSGEKARELSQQLESLAIDFASFHNLSDTEAMERFISALSGSSEVLDKFGINTKAAALEQELLAMGVKKAWTEVSEQEKAMARLNVIAKSMGSQGAVGDAVKTAGSFTNQLKALQARAKDTAIEIGSALLPAANNLLTKINAFITPMQEWVKANGELVIGLGALTAALLVASPAIVGVSVALDLLTVAFRAAAAAMALFTRHPVVAVLTALAGALLYAISRTEWFARVMERLNVAIKDLIGAEAELTAEVKKGNEALAKRAELQGKIAENRAKTGNPWGINADRKPPAEQSPRRAIPQLDTFKFGPTAIIQVMPDGPSHLGPRPMKRPGDDELQALDPFNGPRGTFSGQLASQIFGTGGESPIVREVRKSNRALDRQTRLLERMNEKIGLGPAHKMGVA